MRPSVCRVAVSRTLPAVLFSTIAVAGALAQSTPIEIDYTGSLMGYYRMEAPETDGKLDPVRNFLKFRDADPSRLLLAMGDNFGPEFGSALQLENTSIPDCAQPALTLTNHETRPESLYKNDNRIARQANCDNVLHFFMRGRFSAVVAGREDFMYTAGWLRGAGRLLAQANKAQASPGASATPPRPVYMLGANLRILLKSSLKLKHSGPDGRAYSVKDRCPLFFSADPFDPRTESCTGAAGEPQELDWLERLDRLDRNAGNGEAGDTRAAIQELAADSAATAAGRKQTLATLIGDEASIMLSAWGARCPQLDEFADFPAALRKLSAENESDLASELGKRIDKLESIAACSNPDLTSDNQAFAAYRNDYIRILKAYREDLSKNTAHSSIFVLEQEGRRAAIAGLLRTIANQQDNAGFTVAALPDGRKVLIVGVIGRDTINAVSETNLRLCIDKPAGDRWPAEFGHCTGRSSNDAPQNGLAAQVIVTDPVNVTTALVRGAEMLYGPLAEVVVMAQMPHTDAEVLATRVWARLRSAGAHPVDIVLSEAQPGYSTPDVVLTYPAPQGAAADAAGHPAPVFTPARKFSSLESSFPGGVSRVSVASNQHNEFTIANRATGVFTPEAMQGGATTLSLLHDLLQKLGIPQPGGQGRANSSQSRTRSELTLLEDLQRASTPRADVVLLQSRDLELNTIEKDYQDYDMCTGDEHPDLCKVRVALDRIFWKGDFLEDVAVTGKDLKQILAASKTKLTEQANLADRDISREWLVSFGIVQSDLKDLTEVSLNNEPLWIPVDPECTGNGVYCIAGSPISDDAYYWLLTTDQLAQDQAVYGTLQKLPLLNHAPSETYLTASIAHYLYGQSAHAPASTAAAAPRAAYSSGAEQVIADDNRKFQQRPLFQIDFTKATAGFTARQPLGGDQFVGQYFQGVSDSRASAPNQQELDLELGSRILHDLPAPERNGKRWWLPGWLGLQSAFAYDRAVLGNLTPTTKPINASYALNNLTVGAFLQFRLDGFRQGVTRSIRSLPRNLLVLTPHQYQMQVNTPYLFFAFAASSPKPGELTVTLPRNTGWTDRAGFRREFGRDAPSARFHLGSYFETGMEYSEQRGLLAGLTLQTGKLVKTCNVSASQTLQACFSQAPALPINSNTVLVGRPQAKTVHTPGLYWMLHVQNHVAGKTPGRQVDLVTDAQGDYYFGRPSSAELPTQTEYAIPFSTALVFPAWGNLSFGPTYSAFFYKSQLSSQSLQVNTFSVAARWFFARDARVPNLKQIRLQGPPSADQTRTSKIH